MALIFYPLIEDLEKKKQLEEQLELLLDGAENYKAVILDAAPSETQAIKTPHDLKVAYNWEGIAVAMRDIKDLPENTPEQKSKKASLLIKLAEIYEVLRCAKMPKLEAVRIALTSEADYLKRK